MRRLLRLTFFTLLIAGLIGCDSGDDNGNGDNGNGGGDGNGDSITATVDGVAFASDFVFSTVTPSGFSFSAQDGDPVILLGLIAESISPGDYDMGQGSSPVTYVATASFVENDGGIVYNARPMSGSITIASYSQDGTARSFRFEAFNVNDESVDVAGGEFDVDF